MQDDKAHRKYNRNAENRIQIKATHVELTLDLDVIERLNEHIDK